MKLLYLALMIVWGAEKIVYFYWDVPFELFNLFAYV